MPGSGGEASAPVNGGEFLLQLLQNPPRHPPPEPQLPQPSRILCHDPAVAALGPSLRIPLPPLLQSNGLPTPWFHHNTPPPFAPHNFFFQNPNASPNPNVNPNPNFNSASPPGFNQAHNQQQNMQFGYNSRADDIRKLDVSGPNPKPSSAQQQDQKDLIFGSFSGNECVINGNSSEKMLVSQEAKGKMCLPILMEGREVSLGRNRRLNALEVENQQNPVDLDGILSGGHERNGSKSTGAVNYDRQGLNRHNHRAAVPPSGFSGKQMSGGNREYVNRRNFEQLGEKSRIKSVAARYQGDKNERDRRFVPKNGRNTGDRLDDPRVSDQLDCPGPLPGRTFHSVSASDIEESMSELHGEDSEREDTFGIGMGEKMSHDHKGHSDLDDLEEQLVDSLGLEDESGEGRNKKKRHDKDYRSDKRGQSLLGQRMRYLKRQLLCRADIDRLDAPFIAIYESLIPPEEEKAKQKQLLSLLDKIVSKKWPDARLYTYGSCANSFGCLKSDIDVCLAIDDADVNKSEVLLKLADMLQSENLQNVQALTRARVPIVKLMDPATGISCDICINNILAVVNTKLLGDYAQIDVRLRQLAFIVKHWAKSRAVNETYQGTLSSYAYVLMCIHFLQQRRPPILPCLQEMETTHYVTVDNTVCAYFDLVENLVGFGSHNQESLAQLVWAFFNYWAYRHDYANDVISVRSGSILSKRSKDWTRRIGNDRHLICIEDPFEVTHDLGRVVDKRSIKVLREEFERAAEVMQFDLSPSVTLFEPYIPA